MVHATSVKLCIRALKPKSCKDMEQAIEELVDRYTSEHKKINIKIDAECEVQKKHGRDRSIRMTDLKEESAVCETMMEIFTEGHVDYRLSTYYVDCTAWGWCYGSYIAALNKECEALELDGFVYWLFFSPEDRSYRCVDHSKGTAGVALAKYCEGLRRLERELASDEDDDDDDSSRDDGEGSESASSVDSGGIVIFGSVVSGLENTPAQDGESSADSDSDTIVVVSGLGDNTPTQDDGSRDDGEGSDSDALEPRAIRSMRMLEEMLRAKSPQ